MANFFISAINANLVQVTLSDDAPALNAENVKISNGVTVNKVTVAGKTVTVETSTLPANRDLTITFSGVENLDKASGTFKYNQTVNLETAIEGFVYVYNAQGEKVPGEGVKVTTLDGTTTADKDGYYKLPSKAGAVEVTMEYKGHYINEADVIVTDKKSTAHVVTMEEIKADKFVVSGFVKDVKNAAAIKDATVKLQEKVDGKWVTVEERTSDATGAYVFANKGVATGALENGTKVTTTDSTDVIAGTDYFTNFGSKAAVNKLKYDADYRIVAEKAGVVAKEDDKPYHEVIKEFNLSKKGPQTTQSPSLKEVQKLEKVNVDFEYTDAVINSVGDEDKIKPAEVAAINYTIYDETGKKVVDEALDADKLKDTTVALTKNGKVYNATQNIVELLEDDNNLYLKTGKYFVKVDDGATALQAFELNVTEGKNPAVTKFVGKEAATATVTSSFNKIPNGLATSPVEGATMNVYENINGVDVLMVEETVDYAVDTDGSSLTTEKNAIARLAEKAYAVDLDHVYIAEGKTTKVEAVTDGVKNFNVPVDAAGVLVSSFDLKTVSHEDSDIDKIDEKAELKIEDLKGVTPFEVIIKDGSGKEVRKEIVELRVDADGEIVKDPNSDLQFVATAAGATNEGHGFVKYSQEATDTQIGVVVNKLLPADYTVSVNSLYGSFKAVTNDKTNVQVFKGQDATDASIENVAKTATLLQTPHVYLTGSLEFADQLKAKAHDIKVRNVATGEFLPGANFKTKVTESGRYSVLLENAPAGKYEVVIYSSDLKNAPTDKASKFETNVKAYDLAKGTNTGHVTVTKGGEAKLDFNIFDENGVRLNSDDVVFTITDAYNTEVDFSGFTSASNGSASTTASLSAGKYAVKITPKTGKNLQSVSQTVNIDRINSTVLTTIDVPVITKGKTYEVSGKVTAAAAAEGAQVAIFNSTDGSLVTTVDTDTDGKYEVMLSNGGYIVKAFYVKDETRHYVAQKEVEVKDRAVKEVNMTATPATR